MPGTMRLEIAAIFVICFAALWTGSDCQVRDCPAGTGNFDPPDDGCYLCSIPECSNCNANYDTSCTECNLRYGLDSTTGFCEPCGADCYNCNYYDAICPECEYSNYGPVKDGTNNGACEPCSPHCSDCMASGYDECDTCEPGYAFDADHLCQPCAQDCQDCKQSGPGNCDSCPLNTGSDNRVDATPEHCIPCEQANCLNCYAYSRQCDFCIEPFTPTSEGYCKPTNLVFIYPEEWWAQKPSRPLTLLPWRDVSVDKIVIHHTHNKIADDDDACKIRTKAMQNDQRNGRWKLYLATIAYHFLICGNGKIMVGRGWNWESQQRRSFPYLTYDIAFLGNFEKRLPTATAVASLDELIEHGKPYDIAEDALVYAHYDVSCRSCPGTMFYKSGILQGRADYGGMYKKDCGPHSRGAGHSSKR